MIYFIKQHNFYFACAFWALHHKHTTLSAAYKALNIDYTDRVHINWVEKWLAWSVQTSSLATLSVICWWYSQEEIIKNTHSLESSSEKNMLRCDAKTNHQYKIVKLSIFWEF